MQKKIVILVATGLSIVFTSVFAQNFFGVDNQSSSAASSPGMPQPPSSQVMTPDQFKSRVDSLSKQVNENSKNQLQQQLKSTPPVPPPPPPSQQSGSSSGLTKDGEQPPAKIELYDKQQAGAPGSGQQPGQRLRPPGAGSAAPPPPNQPQSYTGFGTGQGGQNNQSAPANSGSSGGSWNINY